MITNIHRLPGSLCRENAYHDLDTCGVALVPPLANSFPAVRLRKNRLIIRHPAQVTCMVQSRTRIEWFTFGPPGFN